jgi:hypothetical protein
LKYESGYFYQLRNESDVNATIIVKNYNQTGTELQNNVISSGGK